VPTFKESRPEWAAFLLKLKDALDRLGIPLTEVFNIFVENSVENGQSTFVSDSSSNASTLCTEASAGIFTSRNLDNILEGPPRQTSGGS
jgi:hypothetical protein